MILEILKHTPIWTFLLFIALVALGYTQSKPRKVPLLQLAIRPVPLMGFSLYGVVSAFGATAPAIAGWLAGIGVAVLANMIFRQPGGATYSAETRTFRVPGSWVPLALMMTIFFAKYAVAVAIAINPPLHVAAIFAGAVSMVYGIASGLFFARALHIRSTMRGPGAPIRSEGGNTGTVESAA